GEDGEPVHAGARFARVVADPMEGARPKRVDPLRLAAAGAPDAIGPAHRDQMRLAGVVGREVTLGLGQRPAGLRRRCHGAESSRTRGYCQVRANRQEWGDWPGLDPGPGTTRSPTCVHDAGANQTT